MEYTTFGTTGVQVSRLCLGTMMFGAQGNTDVADCTRIIHAALDAGINFVDTADVYGGQGGTEEIVGAALHGIENICCLTGDDVTAGDEPEARRVFDLDSPQLLETARGIAAGRYLSGRAVGVAEVEAALQQAERLGGKRVMGPERAPTGLVVGHFTDPEGNLIGVAGTA